MDDHELEARLNAPDLTESEDGAWSLDVEHYPLPDGSDIADPTLRTAWQDALALLSRDEVAEEEEDEDTEESHSKAAIPQSVVTRIYFGIQENECGDYFNEAKMLRLGKHGIKVYLESMYREEAAQYGIEPLAEAVWQYLKATL